ncbi:MAG TPA: hypothetical protein VFF78_02515, partial [Anaerolineaceae bacterium]|nr:hypothetical protein [Anaerolineaceae bacterium]
MKLGDNISSSQTLYLGKRDSMGERISHYSIIGAVRNAAAPLAQWSVMAPDLAQIQVDLVKRFSSTPELLPGCEQCRS